MLYHYFVVIFICTCITLWFSISQHKFDPQVAYSFWRLVEKSYLFPFQEDVDHGTAEQDHRILSPLLWQNKQSLLAAKKISSSVSRADPYSTHSQIQKQCFMKEKCHENQLIINCWGKKNLHTVETRWRLLVDH